MKAVLHCSFALLCFQLFNFLVGWLVKLFWVLWFYFPLTPPCAVLTCLGFSVKGTKGIQILAVWKTKDPGKIFTRRFKNKHLNRKQWIPAMQIFRYILFILGKTIKYKNFPQRKHPRISVTVSSGELCKPQLAILSSSDRRDRDTSRLSPRRLRGQPSLLLTLTCAACSQTPVWKTCCGTSALRSSRGRMRRHDAPTGTPSSSPSTPPWMRWAGTPTGPQAFPSWPSWHVQG